MNRSLTAAGTSDPILARRARDEQRWITEIHDNLAREVAVVPWQPEPPAGAAGLTQLLGFPALP